MFTINENLNSNIFKFRSTIGDHNYDDSFGLEMVRIQQESSQGNVSQANGDNTRGNGSNESFQVSSVSRSTATWTGSKSSIAIIYPCYLCNYETCRSTSLVAHLRQHRQGSLSLEAERFQIGKFVCGVCNFKTRWLSSLKEHEQKAHFNDNANITNTINNERPLKGSTPYNCRHCGYSTEKMETISTHMKRHFTSTNLFGNIVRNYPCCLCEFTTRQLDELQNHIETVHSSIDVSDIEFDEHSSLITCTKCDHICSNPEDMVLHLQQHEDDGQSYACDYCSHRSASIYLWRDHMESHGGVLEISIASMHH